MKLPRRRLLAVAAFTSAILFVGVLVVWIRARTVSDTLSWFTEEDVGEELWETTTVIASNRGSLGISRTHHPSSPGSRPYREAFSWWRDSNSWDTHSVGPFDEVKIDFLGMTIIRRFATRMNWAETGWGSYTVVPDGPKFFAGWGITVPLWLLALSSAILPWLWLSRRYREVRASRLLRAGRCRICGYDLRATPERCPECGVVPEAAKVAG